MLARLTIAMLAAGLIAAAYAGQALQPQTSDRGGVAITITPRSPSAAAGFAFEIALDTHTQELIEDLRTTAVLVTDDGRVHQPATWKGDRPGGHHRKGVLVFEPVTPQPRSLELRLQRPGESTPRIFRWTVQ